jgi:6-carboxyhexanoate--CoA ligase
MRAEAGSRHISGAEDICPEKEIAKTVASYVERALRHSKGRPEKIHLTIERLSKRPLVIESLPVRTLRTRGASDAYEKAGRVLLSLPGVTGAAMRTARRVLSTGNLSGAALITPGGRRVGGDKKGVRARCLGIAAGARKKLEGELKRKGIYHYRVMEALALASKVAFAPGVAAELCVSDDPDYTTGYIASRGLGYLRVPHIKRKGSLLGGRVFFLKGEKGSLRDLTAYLRQEPVVIGKTGEVGVIITLHELLGDNIQPRRAKIFTTKSRSGC